MIIGAALHAVRNLDFRTRIDSPVIAIHPQRSNQAREREGGRDAQLERVALGFHAREFIPAAHAYVEQLHASEQIAVLVAERRGQPEVVRRGGSLQLDRVALPQRRRAEDVAVEIPFRGIGDGRSVGRGAGAADISDRTVPAGRVGRFRKEHAGAFVVSQPHDILISSLDVALVVQRIRIKIHGTAENRGADFRTGVVNDFQSPVESRVEPRIVQAVAHRLRRVVSRKDIDIAQAVYSILLNDRLPLGRIACHIGLDDHRQVDRAVAGGRIGDILDVVDREVVVSPVLQERRDARPFVVEHVAVENAAGTEQRGSRIAQDDRPQRPVAEAIADLPDPVRIALTGEVGDAGPLAGRVDTEPCLGLQKTLAVHVDLHRLRGTGRQRRVEQYGRFPDLALEAVPPCVLPFRVGGVIRPKVKVRSQQALRGMLANELLQIGLRDAFLLGKLAVALDPDVVAGQQVTPLRDMLRHAACPREPAACDRRGEPRASPRSPIYSPLWFRHAFLPPIYFASLNLIRNTPSAQSLETIATGGISLVLLTCFPMQGQLSKEPIWTIRTSVAPSGSRDRS